LPVAEPFPELDELLAAIGEAGATLAAINASEGAAGNISVCIGWPMETRRRFPSAEPYELPVPVPALAGRIVIVTGSGRRLRELVADPAANLGVVTVGADGRSASLWTSPRRLFATLTSELNSHLAVHDDFVGRTGGNFNALIHAQPPYLTYLSHIPAYREEAELNRRLLRWEPETIVNLPAGIGILPFAVPSSAELMAANVEGLRHHRIVVWSKHGVMARSDQSVKRAADRIEYAETAARYEYMNLVNGERGEGLTRDELAAVVDAFGVRTTLVPTSTPAAIPAAVREPEEFDGA
jgi:rhamnulose-1-phosphate aldolase